MPRPLALAVVILSLTAPPARAGGDPPAPVPSPAGLRQAVSEGLLLVQKAAERYPTHRDCFSCHHQTLPMMAVAAARRHGLDAGASALMDEQAEFTLETFRSKRGALREGRGIGGGAMTVGYGLWALHLAAHPRDETTDAMVAFLLKTQRAEGHWPTGHRPPLEESTVTCTALAARGIEWYAPPARRAESEAAVEKAVGWLRKAPTRLAEDRTSRLWALRHFGIDAVGALSLIDDILRTQNDDGGWSPADGLPSDAYATGQTLARLKLPSDHPASRRGVSYLLGTRQPDGSWRVETRSKPIQVDFDNGDPHGKNQFISTPATCWAVAALAGALPGVGGEGEPEKGEAPYDLVIRGGRVVDGTGNPWFDGDVAVRSDRIVAVGRLPEGVEAKRVVDARGLVVAPGFIDMHSHSDTSLFVDGAAMSKVTQGVTTEVLGEDTSGGPSKGKRPPKSHRWPDGVTVRWETFGGYLDAVEKSGTAVNVASYVGLGSLLGCVLGDALDRPSAAQFDEVKSLLDEALGQGAFGLSTMLAGPRELNVTTEDLVALGRVVRKHGGIYSSHIRNEGTDVIAAVDEAIAVGERAGIPVDIIHLKIAEQSLWGRMGELVARIDAARARGVNVQANVYPYTRGNNDLVSIIPPWAHEGGTKALLGRLADPPQRARIKAEIKSGLPGWYNHYTAVGGDWDRMLISARLSAANAGFQGRTMREVIAARSDPREGRPVPDPLDVFLDFLAEEGGSVSTIYAHHTEADMNRALVQPWCSIGSDGTALAVEGPLRAGHPHPRSFGTFPRVLGVYVREKHLLTLEDAVRKMTSLNAAKIGLTDRGLVRAGMFADLTVFDPATVADRATYLEPFRYSEGIALVVVNGTPVLENGKPTGARPGRALRNKAR